MAKDIVTLDAADKMLASLNRALDKAEALNDLDRVQREAGAFRYAMKAARFELQAQNQFFKIRARTLRRMGELLATMPKHPGGDPRPREADPIPAGYGVPGPQPLTLAELGVSPNLSVACQQIARQPQEVFDGYLALGDVADDDIEEVPLWGSSDFTKVRVVELTKIGLINWGKAFAHKKSTDESNARLAEAALAQAQRDVQRDIERAALAQAQRDIEPAPKAQPRTPPPPEPPEPPTSLERPRAPRSKPRCVQPWTPRQIPMRQPPPSEWFNVRTRDSKAWTGMTET